MNRLPTPVFLGFSGGSAGKESAHNVGDLGSIPGLGRFPWRRERLPTPVFWPGEFQGLYSPWGCKESETTERLSDWVDLQRYVSFWYPAKWFKYKYIYSFFLLFFQYRLLLCYIVNPYLFILYMTVSVNPKQWISPFIVFLFGNHMLFSVFVIVL